MFWKSRRKIARLERHVAQLRQQNEQVLARISALTAAVSAGQTTGPHEHIITKMMEVQGGQFESAGNFLKTINEIALERAGAALGKRGGQRRAATAKRGRGGQFMPNRSRSDCPLCSDPMTANFTMDEWKAHQTHRPGRAREAERTIDAEAYADRGTIEVGQQPQYPLPAINVPGGDATAGAGGDSPEGEIDHGDHIHKADGSVVRKADFAERN